MHVGEDGQSINPPRIKKKIRPFSAPRHQGLRSAGLKNRVNQGGDGMRPGTQDGQYGQYGDFNNQPGPHQMETVNEQNQQYFEEDQDE